MSEILGLTSLAMKKKVAALTSKTHVTIETTKPEVLTKTAAEQQLRKIEIEMESADHAFALVSEIKQKLEKALDDLTPQ